MTRYLLCSAVILAAAACGSSRSSYARYPGAPAAFDRAGSEPKALEVADAMFAAAGGPGNWEKAKQIRWKQTVTSDGKVTLTGEEAWDRWNARHHGRLMMGEQDIVVGYDLYGTHSMGYMQQGHRKENLDDAGRKKGLDTAKAVFNLDTAVLLMQFLVLEPGTKLKYIGQAKDDKGSDNYDEIAVTFDDPLRKDLEFRAIVDRTTHLPQRIEIVKGVQKIGYTLTSWTTVNGMKFATARGNLGYSGETTAISDIQVSDPDDELFIAPL